MSPEDESDLPTKTNECGLHRLTEYIHLHKNNSYDLHRVITHSLDHRLVLKFKKVREMSISNSPAILID